MSKQVLDIDQVKHLQELGLDTSKASMQYIENNNGIQMCIPTEIARYIKDLEKGYIICDAFTLQDILDILPKDIKPKDIKAKSWYEYSMEIFCISDCKKWEIGYYLYDESIDDSFFRHDNLIDSAYEALCWCIENGYINTKKED